METTNNMLEKHISYSCNDISLIDVSSYSYHKALKIFKSTIDSFFPVIKRRKNDSSYTARFLRNVHIMEIDPLYKKEILCENKFCTSYSITIEENSVKTNGGFCFFWLDPFISPEEKHEHSNIQFMLMKAYKRHEEQFKIINALPLIFHIVPEDKDHENCYGIMTTCSEPMKFNFTNHFLKNGDWICFNNIKYSTWHKRDSIYFSNIFAYQFKKAHESHKLPMRLPKTITQNNITNVETLALLKKYQGKYASASFKREFLSETVNGKSTVRLANTFGLKITRLTVKKIDVIAHVEIDKEI